MTTEQALLRIAASTDEAVRRVLETIAPGAVVAGKADVVAAGEDPFAEAPFPAVLADVSYVDGVNGGNLLTIGIDGAHRLAATMMGKDPAAVDAEGELDELAMSAIGEAMNQMMSAAATATAQVLGDEVEIAPPSLTIVRSPAEAGAAAEHNAHACTVSFTLCGAPCLLVQLVPHAFVMRMTRAYDELTANYASAPMSESLRTVSVRVWAELGRTRMPSARAVALPGGTVVELDRELDEPIDLYADGMRFATGRLHVCDDGSLAVRIESLVGAPGQAQADDAFPQDNDIDGSMEEVA